MKRTSAAVVAVLAIAAAVTAIVALRSESPPAKAIPVAATPPISIAAPVSFTVRQRSSTSLPGSSGRIVTTLDDITEGQVLTTISWQDGRPIVATRSLREGDAVTFTVNAHAFTITLRRLTNVLAGEDSAEFELAPVAAFVPGGLSEEERIGMLLQSLEGLVDAKFIRNGKEHTVDEAVAHLRSKWEWKKRDIKTAEDFIDIAGSESTTSGDPYLIELRDGTIVKSGDWLHEQLAKQEVPRPSAPVDANRPLR